MPHVLLASVRGRGSQTLIVWADKGAVGILGVRAPGTRWSHGADLAPW